MKKNITKAALIIAIIPMISYNTAKPTGTTTAYYSAGGQCLSITAQTPCFTTTGGGVWASIKEWVGIDRPLYAAKINATTCSTQRLYWKC
jgi:hypothetical protein